MSNSPLSKRLKEARLLADLSQKQLGIKADMDQFSASARMNHYEQGRHTPDFSTLKRIAKVLHLPVAYFYAESDEVATLIAGFSKLSKSDKAAILKMIGNLLK